MLFGILGPAHPAAGGLVAVGDRVRRQLFFSSWANITRMPLGPRT
jgi:hypothetical protein